VQRPFIEVDKIYNEFNKMSINVRDEFVKTLKNFHGAVQALSKTPLEQATFETHDVDLRFFSDCAIWSFPSDKFHKLDRVFVIIAICKALNLLQAVMYHNRVLIRGGIGEGNLYIDGNKIFGDALAKAYELEQCAEFPQIVFEKEFIEKAEANLMPMLTNQITLDPRGFYAYDYFKELEYLKKTEEDNSLPYDFNGIRYETYIKPIVALLPEGLKHKSQRVRDKYRWLLAKVDPFMNKTAGTLSR
jgi:hypothetical protein